MLWQAKGHSRESSACHHKAGTGRGGAWPPLALNAWLATDSKQKQALAAGQQPADLKAHWSTCHPGGCPYWRYSSKYASVLPALSAQQLSCQQHTRTPPVLHAAAHTVSVLRGQQRTTRLSDNLNAGTLTEHTEALDMFAAADVCW